MSDGVDACGSKSDVSGMFVDESAGSHVHAHVQCVCVCAYVCVAFAFKFLLVGVFVGLHD